MGRAGIGAGPTGSGLDERHAASLCLSLPAAHDHQSDGLVDQESRRLHRDLARRQPAPGTIDFRFDASAEVWRSWINSQFGEGIITWNTPFLFRTKPRGLAPPGLRPGQLLQGQRPPAHRTDRERLDQHVVHDELEDDDPRLAGPVRAGRAALPGDPAGEQRLRRPGDGRRLVPEAERQPRAVTAPIRSGTMGRRRFHEQKASGEVKPDDWQKDYFQGRDAIGQRGRDRTT